MAAIRQHRHISWIDCHNRAVESKDEELDPLNGHDDLVSEYLNDDAAYWNAILANNKFNFILAPSTARGEINCLHQGG